MEGRSEERVHESKISPRVSPRWVTVIRAVSLHYSVFILQAFLIAPLFVWGFSSYQGITTHPKLSKKFQRLNENHFRRKIPVIIVPNFETRVNHCVYDMVVPQQKVRKIDHVWSTCVLVGLKDVQRFSVHLLLVSFGHRRPLAASQVTGRKDMEVPHKFTQP